MERILPRANHKVPVEWRVLAGLAGGALLAFGLSRRARLRGLVGSWSAPIC